MNWMDRAACNSLPTDAFFEPEREEFQSFNDFVDARNKSYRAAKEVCKGCHVLRECLLENLFQRHGIWGGKTPGERQSLAKKLKMKPPEQPRRSTEDGGVTDFTVDQILKFYDDGRSYKDIESLTGVHRGVIYRLIVHHRDEERTKRDGGQQIEFPSEETGERRKAEGAFRVQALQNWSDPKYKQARDLLMQGGIPKKDIIATTGIPKTSLYRLELGMKMAGVLK
jgi:hypothetical protein